jgi:hypothetical protein
MITAAIWGIGLGLAMGLAFVGLVRTAPRE